MAEREIAPLGPGDHVRGADGAELELVMYGDFECPYCAAAQSIVARVRDRLGERLRFAFRHFPLEDVHPHALRAAEAAEAAAAQDAFWEMHDALYGARGRLAERDLVALARALGLDAGRVTAELTAGVHSERVRRDLAGGRAAGVTGTPAFFVNGVRLGGAFDAGSLVDALSATAAERAASA
ncbi:MAG TPA: DsbA family protein [Solirubrobacteraceae bacterium]|nr:DsbA family protein [Solirubrobacteraceae bacterium]